MKFFEVLTHASVKLEHQTSADKDTEIPGTSVSSLSGRTDRHWTVFSGKSGQKLEKDRTRTAYKPTSGTDMIFKSSTARGEEIKKTEFNEFFNEVKI